MSERRTKSATAFLTISEVSNALTIPQHILRFWETKFPQLRPLKRAGGRRYFRPEDVALVETINRLLGQDGYTIRGVQKLMREGEIKRATSHDDEASLPLGLDTLDQPKRAVSAIDSRPARSPTKAAAQVYHTHDDRYKNSLREILVELVEIKNTLAR